MALFKDFGSRPTRSFPFGFLNATSPLTQWFGFWTGSMISKSTIHFNSFSNFGFKASGIFLTGVTTGVLFSLISIWWVFFRVPISPKQLENSNKNCSSLTITAEICFIRFRLSLAANHRTRTDFGSTTTNKTSKWSFWCFRVSEHFPSTGILELLYMDNFMFTGQRSGSGWNFFKIVKGITLHWAPVSILYETGISFEGTAIDQSEFSFLIWLIWEESWILTVSKKNS